MFNVHKIAFGLALSITFLGPSFGAAAQVVIGKDVDDVVAEIGVAVAQEGVDTNAIVGEKMVAWLGIRESAGMDIDTADSMGESPLLKIVAMAVRRPMGTTLYRAAVVRWLLANGAKIDAYNEKNCSATFTVLRFAVMGGLTDIVEVLIDAGANLNPCEVSGFDPQQLTWTAAIYSDADIFEKLIRAGARFDAKQRFMNSKTMQVEVSLLSYAKNLASRRAIAGEQRFSDALLEDMAQSAVRIVRILEEEGAGESVVTVQEFSEDLGKQLYAQERRLEARRLERPGKLTLLQ